MAKYPISIQDSISDGKVSQAFHELLKLHVSENDKILDPTAGSRLLWKNILFPGDSLQMGITPEYDVVFSDLKGGEGNLTQNLVTAPQERSDWVSWFDVVVYDPPYLINSNNSNDPRESQYGNYSHSLKELAGYISLVSKVIPALLKPKGKLIIKCSDQYVVPERKFYLHHYEWITRMIEAFTIIDLMIYRHHRMSPTAFQVKDRPCCVIMHTYYIVGVKND